MAIAYTFTLGAGSVPAAINPALLAKQLRESDIVYTTESTPPTDLTSSGVSLGEPAPGQFRVEWNVDLGTSPLGLAAAEALQDSIIAAHNAGEGIPDVGTRTSPGKLRDYETGYSVLRLDLATPGTVTLPPSASLPRGFQLLSVGAGTVTLEPDVSDTINGTAAPAILPTGGGASTAANPETSDQAVSLTGPAYGGGDDQTVVEAGTQLVLPTPVAAPDPAGAYFPLTRNTPVRIVNDAGSPSSETEDEHGRNYWDPVTNTLRFADCTPGDIVFMTLRLRRRNNFNRSALEFLITLGPGEPDELTSQFAYPRFDDGAGIGDVFPLPLNFTVTAGMVAAGATLDAVAQNNGMNLAVLAFEFRSFCTR